MPTRLEKYLIQDDSPVTLNALVGNAQLGSVSVHLANALLAHGPVIQSLPLGSGNALKGKRLVISSIVLDVRPETDSTSLTVSLSGAGGTESWLDSEKAAPGGVVSYITVIDFQ